MLVALVIGGVLVSVFATPLMVSSSIESVARVVGDQLPIEGLPTSIDNLSADLVAGPVRLKGRFGSEGMGPGKFDDARAIAVDNAGNLYVGEYTSGRVQVFDSEGGFKTQWLLGDDNAYVDQFAAGRDGTLFAPYRGDLRPVRRRHGRTSGQCAASGRRSVRFLR